MNLLHKSSRLNAFFMRNQGATQDYAASILTSLDHPQFQTHIWRSDKPVAHNTQQTQQTNIHAPGGIRTRNYSNRAAAYVDRTVTGIGNIRVWLATIFPASCSNGNLITGSYDRSPYVAAILLTT